MKIGSWVTIRAIVTMTYLCVGLLDMKSLSSAVPKI